MTGLFTHGSAVLPIGSVSYLCTPLSVVTCICTVFLRIDKLIIYPSLAEIVLSWFPVQETSYQYSLFFFGGEMLKECQDIKILYYTLMYQVMREQYAKEMAGGTTIP